MDHTCDNFPKHVTVHACITKVGMATSSCMDSNPEGSGDASNKVAYLYSLINHDIVDLDLSIYLYRLNCIKRLSPTATVCSPENYKDNWSSDCEKNSM